MTDEQRVNEESVESGPDLDLHVNGGDPEDPDPDDPQAAADEAED